MICRCKNDAASAKENKEYTELATEDENEPEVKSVEKIRNDVLSEWHEESDENVLTDIAESEKSKEAMEDTMSEPPTSPDDPKKHSVTLVDEAAAEPSVSDTEPENPDTISVSAYGDIPGGSLVTNILSHGTARLQVSIIYNRDKKYVAGKISQLDGIPTRDEKGPDQVKVHLVLLPTKKYVLKTRFYYVNVKCKFDEYFKLKFRSEPDLEVTSLRFRVYGRRIKLGIAGREKCLGETKVRLIEVVQSPGGVTLWRKMVSKGHDIPKYASISESE